MAYALSFLAGPALLLAFNCWCVAASPNEIGEKARQEDTCLMQIGVEFHSRRGKARTSEASMVSEPCNMNDGVSLMQTDVISEARATPVSHRVAAGISSGGGVEVREDASQRHPLFVNDAVSLLQSTGFVRQGKLGDRVARGKAPTNQHPASTKDTPAVKDSGKLWFGQRLPDAWATTWDYQKWAILAIGAALLLQLILWIAAKAKMLKHCRCRSRDKRLHLSASELASSQQASSLALDLQQQLLLSSSQAALHKKLSFTFALNQLLDHVSVDVKLSGRAEGPAFVATLTEDEKAGRTLKLASAVEPARGLMSVGPLRDGGVVHRFSTGCQIGMLKAVRPGVWCISKNDAVSLRMTSPAPLTVVVNKNGSEVAWVKPASQDAGPANPEVCATMCELTVEEGSDSVLLVSCALAALIVSCSSGD